MNLKLYFVCDENDNQRIIKITKQEKRAMDMMTKPNICVIRYNVGFYPNVANLKVGECLNEVSIELERNREREKIE